MGHRPDERARHLGAPERFLPYPPVTPTITLSVPARPEALGIVRLVLMSCGASAGVDIDEIFARSHEVVESFMNVLMSRPDASMIVIRTQTGAEAVELVPFDRTSARP